MPQLQACTNGSSRTSELENNRQVITQLRRLAARMASRRCSLPSRRGANDPRAPLVARRPAYAAVSCASSCRTSASHPGLFPSLASSSAVRAFPASRFSWMVSHCRIFFFRLRTFFSSAAGPSSPTSPPAVGPAPPACGGGAALEGAAGAANDILAMSAAAASPSSPAAFLAFRAAFFFADLDTGAFLISSSGKKPGGWFGPFVICLPLDS
mmetsp:Transcript_13058/g.33544  ORF Transcript_13058/g.33544 Transcript_13058/m.33544 type:complete len:211 (+) Transcript_13058:30-662(+)